MPSSSNKIAATTPTISQIYLVASGLAAVSCYVLSSSGTLKGSKSQLFPGLITATGMGYAIKGKLKLMKTLLLHNDFQG